MKKQDYSNLKNKTFLDYTDNENVIEDIINGEDKSVFTENISDYGRFITFLEFAEITENKDLEKEVIKQLGSVENE